MSDLLDPPPYANCLCGDPVTWRWLPADGLNAGRWEALDSDGTAHKLRCVMVLRLGPGEPRPAGLRMARAGEERNGDE